MFINFSFIPDKEETKHDNSLLWKSDEVNLPNSYDMALTRLKGIKRKMDRDKVFCKTYNDVISGYIDKGYVPKISHAEAWLPSKKKWYLPHFGVVNLNEPQKLRLVFDTAAQFGTISLNSQLLKGPQDIELLPNILYNFPRGKIAVYADIQEMFHQIRIRVENRISQRFLCSIRQNPPDKYEMLVTPLSTVNIVHQPLKPLWNTIMWMIL